MAKEKLFTPEDFDKPKDKNFWKILKDWILKNKGWTFTILIVVAIVLYCNHYNKGEQKQVNGIEKEQFSNNHGSAVPYKEIEDVETEAIHEVQDVTNVEPETLPTTVLDDPKQEVIQENTTLRREVQSVSVSNNLEQEAMNVIRGNYGNLPERRDKLGNKYQEIQNRVNQLKKEGVF